MVQLVDEQDKCPVYSQHARQCPLKDEYVKDCRRKDERWTCPSWTEGEADSAAEMINLLSDHYVKAGVPVILIEAGGVKKSVCRLQQVESQQLCCFLERPVARSVFREATR